jgi:hypothetical protein
MWENIVQPDRARMTIWRMCIACWIPKATNTHLYYVKLVAFPLQQWLHERSSLLRYTYIACHVALKITFIARLIAQSTLGRAVAHCIMAS